MALEFTVVDIWVGHFESGVRLHDYLAERPEFYQDETEQMSISAFAEDVGERFLDHDFECTMFTDEPTSDITHLVRASLITDRFGDVGGAVGAEVIAARYTEQRAEAVNSVILMYNEEVKRPRSTQGPSYWTHYLGRYHEQ